jgi:predicted esterase
VGLSVVLAAVVALRPDLIATLRGMAQPSAPAALTVVMRADLSPASPSDGSYAPPDTLSPHVLDFAGQMRRFYALPAKGQTGLPPLILLLHGSGRDGRAMLDMWQAIAGQGAFLVAPDALDSHRWDPTADGPAFLAAVLVDARRIQNFDPQRIFLYGHSSGANMALYLGACTDFPARAIALHAGATGPCPAFAARPLHPWLIQIGDQDASFPLPAVRASAERIAALGSPVELQIIPGHTHWFYDIGPSLAAEAWTFFQR